MARDRSKLCCSFCANVVGIKFYPGIKHLEPVVCVYLCREPDNIHDSNAVKAYIGECSSSKALGHLEKDIASVIAPMMDCLDGFRCVAYVGCLFKPLKCNNYDRTFRSTINGMEFRYK